MEHRSSTPRMDLRGADMPARLGRALIWDWRQVPKRLKPRSVDGAGGRRVRSMAVISLVVPDAVECRLVKMGEHVGWGV
eukprot:3338003-Rhodomonas_salina.1